MLDRLDEETLQMATIVVAVLAAVVLLCYLGIFINPRVPLNPFPPPPGPSPTGVVFATLPPTWTPVPSPTNTPTATPTPRPTATSISSPTAIPTLFVSPTPTLTPTPVPSPTERPPTSTPAPLPFAPGDQRGGTDCRQTLFFGLVYNAGGQPMSGVQIRARQADSNEWQGPATSKDGYYELLVADKPVDGLWYLQVLENGRVASELYGYWSSVNCEFGKQKFKVDWWRSP